MLIWLWLQCLFNKSPSSFFMPSHFSSTYQPRYRQQARYLSNIHKDQPGHPVSRAVYWIGYILRHNGASHLRSAVYEVSLYQYFLLDVVITVGAAMALAVFALRRLARLLRGRSRDHSRGDNVRDDGSMANGHCHNENMANGKHKRNGSLKNEKKINWCFERLGGMRKKLPYRLSSSFWFTGFMKVWKEGCS